MARRSRRRVARLQVAEPPEKRKNAIERFFDRDPQKAEQFYNKMRLNLARKYSQLVLALEANGVIVSHKAEVEVKIRRKTGHRQFKVVGVQSDHSINWSRAQEIFTNSITPLQTLWSELDYFNRVAVRNQFSIHELPIEFPKNIEAIRLFVMSKGTNRLVL